MKKPIVVGATLLFLGLALYLLNRPAVIEQADLQMPLSEQTPAPESVSTSTPTLAAAPTPAEKVTPVTAEKITLPDYLQEYSDLPAEHRASLHTHSTKLSQFSVRGGHSSHLTRELEQLGLAPKLKIDENPYTGRLTIVRTGQVLPGTRNLHVQYFSDDDGSEYVQHYSFEFRPGKSSLKAAEASILHAFSERELELTQSTESFRSWRTDDGYIVWMKQLDENDLEDLAHDPFNLYTSSDIGVIRVAIELDIHDHAPAFHAEQGPLDDTSN
jgi:hypothetical protein